MQLNYSLTFAVCSFCELFREEMEERDLDPEEELIFRFHLRTAHGMTI